MSKKGCSTCGRIVNDPAIEEGMVGEDTCKGCGCVYDKILDWLQEQHGLVDNPALDVITAVAEGKVWEIPQSRHEGDTKGRKWEVMERGGRR